MLCIISDYPVIPTSSVTQHSLDSTNVPVGTIIGVSFCGVLLFAILVIIVSIIVFIIVWERRRTVNSKDLKLQTVYINSTEQLIFFHVIFPLEK